MLSLSLFNSYVRTLHQSAMMTGYFSAHYKLPTIPLLVVLEVQGMERHRHWEQFSSFEEDGRKFYEVYIVEFYDIVDFNNVVEFYSWTRLIIPSYMALLMFPCSFCSSFCII